MKPTQDQLDIAAIVFPRVLRRQEEIAQYNTRFVHYTTAEVAFSILTKREVWMRNAQVMNDFSEIEHGFNCLNESYKGDTGKAFQSLLNGMFPGITTEIEALFSGWLPHFRSQTYITCVSEHLDTEDSTGRLSMWRAYGGTSGVALIVNNAPFLGATNALGAYSSPVAYLRAPEFDDSFKEVVVTMEASKAIVAGLPRQTVVAIIFQMLRYAVLCTKHPGFAEEKEWRVIYAPTFQVSDKITHDYQVVSGTPQSIYKLPLKDFPNEGLVGLEINSFLDRIIIGPTQLPGTVYSTLSRVLTEAGVADVDQRLCISDIPLRR